MRMPIVGYCFLSIVCAPGNVGVGCDQFDLHSQFAGVACQRIHTACVVWGWGVCDSVMWSNELCNCVAASKDNFYVCVFEKVSNFSNLW